MRALIFIAIALVMAAIVFGGAFVVALLLSALHNDENDEKEC